MLAARELIEMAPIEAAVPLAIQAQDPLDFRHRRALGGGFDAPPVVQPVVAVVLEAQPEPADAARTAPQDVGDLQPGQVATQGPEDDFVDSHGSLSCRAREGHRHLPEGDIPHGPALERSCHVLLPSGQMMCSLHPPARDLKRPGRADYYLRYLYAPIFGTER